MKTSRLVGRSAGALAGKVVGAAAALGYNLALARSLGPEHYGVFGLAFAFFRASATFARVGLDFIVLRRIAVAKERGDQGEVQGVFAHGGALTLLWATGFALLLATTGPLIGRAMGVEELGGTIQRMSVGIPLWALAWVWGESLKGVGRAVASALVEFAVIHVVALLAFLVVADGGLAWASWTLVLGSGAGAALAVAYWAIAAGVRPALRVRLQAPVLRELMVAGAPLVVVTITNMILMWTDLVVLGWMRGAEAAGLYNAALKLTTAVQFSLVAVSGVLTPVFASAAAARDGVAVRRHFRRGAGLATGIAAPLALAIFVFPGFFLGLFGSGFGAVAGPLRILVVSQLLHAMLGLGGYLLVMAGGERAMQRWVVFAAVLNVVGNLILIPAFGAYGAATATAASTLVMDVFTTVAAFRVVKARARA